MRFYFRDGICSVLVLISFFTNANVIQESLDKVNWVFTGTRFQCQMETRLRFDGEVKVTARSASPLSFELTTHQRPYVVDHATLTLNAAPWDEHKQLRGLINGVAVGEKTVRFDNTPSLHYLLNEMERGAWGQVSVQYHQYQDSKHWDIPSVNFSSAYQQMKLCMSELMPIDFATARDNYFLFELGQSSLSARQQQLIRDIAALMAFDPAISRVLVDGHTDNSGDRLKNLTLSRQRAEMVKQAFVDAGVAPSRIHVRSHGQRYPKNDNATEAQRRENRRVQVRLQREASA
ncbi:OmpA family protein [Thaumasiovibrio sp. DFM-14]|uniref:OmpA family protein n=1 Tax=Thaumasiovibrio sp. DFM-14 TaxID=3384792 RepID=UPI0039A1AC54